MIGRCAVLAGTETKLATTVFGNWHYGLDLQHVGRRGLVTDGGTRVCLDAVGYRKSGATSENRIDLIIDFGSLPRNLRGEESA
jgi:hypothetical protein